MAVQIELSIGYPSVVSSTKVKWMSILHVRLHKSKLACSVACSKVWFLFHFIIIIIIISHGIRLNTPYSSNLSSLMKEHVHSFSGYFTQLHGK